MRGYQFDIDGRNNYTGQNYEEKGRLFLATRGQVTSKIRPVKRRRSFLSLGRRTSVIVTPASRAYWPIVSLLSGWWK